MKGKILILVFTFIVGFVTGQQKVIDSIKPHLPTTNDTLMLVWSTMLAEAYNEVDTDSAQVYDKIYLAMSKKLNLALQEADALMQIGIRMIFSNPSDAIDFLYTAHQIIDHPANKNVLPANYLKMLKVPASITTTRQYQEYLLGKNNFYYGLLYQLNNRNKKALEYLNNSLAIARSLQAPDLIADSYMGIGILTKDDDSSLYYLEKGRQLSKENGFQDKVAAIENFMAKRYAAKKDFRSELFYRRSALDKNISLGKINQLGWCYLGMADYYNKSAINKDSALLYAHKAMGIAEQMHSTGIKYWATLILANLYIEAGKKDSAYKYLELQLKAQAKISSDEKARQFENADYSKQTQESAIQAASEQLRNKVKTYSLLAGIAVLTLLAIIFWRNNKRKQKEYALLEKQKTKTDEALRTLQSTQAQLIQSEKMASLGELTAGIAHEIQNPLNFVNNFSEVTNELIGEMKDELLKRNYEEVNSIADDVKQNLEKINHHGRRAGDIVKSMLQHSRSVAGTKEPTDINKLTDEYARLAYHGLRAKDKTFNATLHSDYDEKIGNINIIPQDIGRVLLNIVTNAFYAVNDKGKTAGAGFIPTVSIRTTKLPGAIEISIKDNGNGIPSHIKEKIFQPFFTTKPTGQGTGLGLSLAYDIVKAHGGELKVETKEGEGSIFLIILTPGN